MTSTEQGENNRILVIDDNESIHQDFRKILSPPEQSGVIESLERDLFEIEAGRRQWPRFELDSAYQGEEGLGKVRHAIQRGSPYAMAFVDIRMPPGWDGVETIHRLWQEDESIQAIICTAYSDYSWEAIASRLGRTDRLLILKKPFDNIEVRQIACAMARKWNLNQRLGIALDRYRALVEASFDAMMLLQPDGRIIDSNGTASLMLGLAKEQIMGRDIREFVSGETTPPGLLDRLDDPEGVLFETLGQRRDGSLFPVEVNVRAFPVAREMLAVVFVRDITRRKHLEVQLRQSQKLEAIGRLAGGIAHDFNNLLCVIDGYCEFLLTSLQTGPQRDHAQQIKHAAEQASWLTRQLLAFSRRQILKPQPVDLNAVLTEMEKMCRRLIGEHIALVTSLSADIGHVKVDQGQMEQVVLNLVLNARDAMPAGGQLTIRTRLADVGQDFSASHPGVDPGQYVLLSVEDSGSGMDRETMSHIFEPFFSTKEKGRGTGLGLATVFGIVEQSGGHIFVRSEVGKGTAFEIYLPGIPVEPTQEERPAASPATALSGTETILLVEDEDGLRALFQETLELWGYRVVPARNAAEAMEAAAHEEMLLHLLLTDVVMPGMSGRELGRRLLQSRPALKVLYTSGYTNDAIVQHGVLEPGIEFIQKPFSPDTLARKVRDVLDARR